MNYPRFLTNNIAANTVTSRKFTDWIPWHHRQCVVSLFKTEVPVQQIPISVGRGSDAPV